jgi:hypothetical protein
MNEVNEGELFAVAGGVLGCAGLWIGTKDFKYGLCFGDYGELP